MVHRQFKPAHDIGGVATTWDLARLTPARRMRVIYLYFPISCLRIKDTVFTTQEQKPVIYGPNNKDCRLTVDGRSLTDPNYLADIPENKQTPTGNANRQSTNRFRSSRDSRSLTPTWKSVLRFVGRRSYEL